MKSMAPAEADELREMHRRAESSPKTKPMASTSHIGVDRLASTDGSGSMNQDYART